MRTTLAVSAVVLIAGILLFQSPDSIECRSTRRSGCRLCPPGGCVEAANCTFGTVTDFCGRKVCAKGPGERCEIRRFRVKGNCGDGMYCHCDRCMGCSVQTFECYQPTCVVPAP